MLTLFLGAPQLCSVRRIPNHKKEAGMHRKYMVHSRQALTLFAEEKESDVRWGKFDPLSFTMALLDIDTALVWMYSSPIFSFEKEAGMHRKKKRYGPQQPLKIKNAGRGNMVY